LKELGSTAKNSTPKTSWLALWGIVETSIGWSILSQNFPSAHVPTSHPAVIIGSCPGLYRASKSAYKTHVASYGSRGYGRQRNSRANAYGGTAGSRSNDIPMYASKGQRNTTTVTGGSRNWDATSSQEELRGEDHNGNGFEINVTKSVHVGVMERDPDSSADWERRAGHYATDRPT
jgi:hypothetical protein